MKTSDVDPGVRFTRARVVWTAVAFALVVGMVGVGALWIWVAVFSSGCTVFEGGKESCAHQVGFRTVEGVELREADRASLHGSVITLRMEGSPRAIDEVLGASGFAGRLAPGSHLNLQVDELVDEDDLADIEAGYYYWTSGSGHEYRREVLRATAEGDGSTQVLYVFAYDD